jgi:hypothetical protein
MAKSRVGRRPLARGKSVLINGNTVQKRLYSGLTATISTAFENARTLRRNEATNLVRYLLNVLDVEGIETSLEVTGDNYDFNIDVTFDKVTLSLSQGRGIGSLAIAA